MDTRSISWNELKKYSCLWVAIAEDGILTGGKSLEEVIKAIFFQSLCGFRSKF